jgi:hypothetical protein
VTDVVIRACLSSPRSCSSLFAAITSLRRAAAARRCGVIATPAAASAASEARRYLGVSADASAEEIQGVAEHYYGSCRS